MNKHNHDTFLALFYHEAPKLILDYEKHFTGKKKYKMPQLFNKNMYIKTIFRRGSTVHRNLYRVNHNRGNNMTENMKLNYPTPVSNTERTSKTYSGWGGNEIRHG